MKLRNRKTGEIIDVYKGQILLHYNQGKKTIQFKSIEELEEWEDYEEPKWFVDAGGEVNGTTYLTDYDKSSLISFGNYLETKEEAEKAVEKLKAWKRLEDKGFRFKGWNTAFCEIDFDVPDSFYPIDGNMITNETEKDLDLLFGGEE